jgi:hypothetical protein
VHFSFFCGIVLTHAAPARIRETVGRNASGTAFLARATNVMKEKLNGKKGEEGS